jgi:hypothetical protein
MVKPTAEIRRREKVIGVSVAPGKISIFPKLPVENWIEKVAIADSALLRFRGHDRFLNQRLFNERPG